ncbi:tRNA (adenosine(37)-N6)-dimethylallyltransferase MiaA [Pectinatus frisingensis]|uniref:tRNA (adenosine(37)-N6)-dimethylallyltransferase MiaA n=1 Tax=Pectinatus frisingensis TaxID=865 RepID=UPI0018C6C22B|nr:tRNA (adenosine(37)-N6)-dimethylallyltransferase MiaA [Pectinatus frisingensis]
MVTAGKAPVIIILGPTAVGKTALSLKLAQKLNTEIISGDSMLVYRGLNIGTAKPTAAELAAVPHHLINILDPGDVFNVTMFCDKSAALIKQLNNVNKLPIIAGGTGLYIKSLIEGYQFNAAPENPQYRAYLENLALKRGRLYVFSLLRDAAPQTAARLHINNFRRIIRALEVYKYNKETISRQKFTTGNDDLFYNALVIGLNRHRADLYKRINKRVDIMMTEGWLTETKKLLQDGVSPQAQSMQAIGYRQLTEYLQNKITLETAVEQIKTATRHFAKRQLTWYRKMPYINWLEIDNLSLDELLGKTYALVQEKFDYR